MSRLQKIKPEWAGNPCVVAAPGPSLTIEIAEQVRSTGWPVLVCQDAWRLMPWADKLYGCDDRWWEVHKGVPDFHGEKWSSCGDAINGNDKRAIADKYDLLLVKGVRDHPDGQEAHSSGFSLDPGLIHYGDNSGYQTINLAILLGAAYIVLVGYDMSKPNGKAHFFGDHPEGLIRQANYERWVPIFEKAAQKLPEGVIIINATENSAIRCFPIMSFGSAVEEYNRLHRDRTEPDARANRIRETEGMSALRL